MPYAIHDKNGNPIVEGDYVWTRYRGGSHQGQVRRLDVTPEASLMSSRSKR